MQDAQPQEKQKNPVPGQYIAKLVDYGITKTKEGKPQVIACFDFKDANGEQFQRLWFGSVNAGKAREITMKSLKAMGLQGGEDRLASLAGGVDSGELSLSSKIQITVVDEVDQQTGEIRSKIRWVNTIGGPAMANRISSAEAADILSRMAGIGSGGFADLNDSSVPF